MAKRVERILRKRRRSIVPAGEVPLQPWFLPKSIGYKVRALLPNDYWRKMRFYFDDYGCLRCERKGGTYGFNGLCRRCYKLVVHRLRFCLAGRSAKGIKPDFTKNQLNRISHAYQLLRDLR